MLDMLYNTALPAAAQAWPVLLDAATKSAMLLAVIFIVTTAMRRSSAAARYLTWMLAVAGLLVLPVVSALLPAWQVLPHWLDPTPQVATESIPAMGRLADMPSVGAVRPVAAIGNVPAMGNAAEPVITTPSAAHVAAATPPPPAALVAPAELRPEPKRARWALVPFVWAAGTGLVLGWLGLSVLSLRRLGRTCTPVNDAAWTALLHRTSGQLGLGTPVALLQADKRCMPMTWGVIRTCLLLPAESAQWSAERRRVVLLHELAHVKRRDPLAQLVTQIACALYWFNPLIWVAARRMVTEREQACDDLVLAAGSPPCDYADHLLHIASGLRTSPLPAAAAIAMARPSSLEGRLRAILDGSRRRRTLTRTASTVLVLAFAGIILPLGMLRAMANAQESTDKPSRFVRLVVGFEGMTFEGREVKWEDMPGLLQNVPERSQTVLELAFPNAVVSSGSEQARKLTQEALARAARLAQEHEFAYVSDIGAHMLGSRGTVRFEAPLEFNKDIPLTLVAGTPERPDVVSVRSIRFEIRDDQIVQKIDGVLYSWPHTNWQFRMELLDGEGHVAGQLDYNLHNNGEVDTAPGTRPAALASEFRPTGSRDLTGDKLPARFVLSIDQKPLETQAVTTHYDLLGTVVDDAGDFSVDRLNRLETAAASGSRDEFDQEFKEMVSPRPAGGAVVTLRGTGIDRKTTTDSAGNFQFTDLETAPPGASLTAQTQPQYELTAVMPDPLAPPGEQRTLVARSTVTVDPDHPVRLEFPARQVRVTGRIADSQGQPISGAKVVGIQEADDNETGELAPHIVTTALSRADGSYELTGVDPPTLYGICGYLNGGTGVGKFGPGSFYLVVRVEADDFVQTRENVPRFPLVTTDRIATARRLMRIMSQAVTRFEGNKDFSEKDGRGPFPSSRGDTITDIDVVLTPWPRAHVSGRVMDTPGRPVFGRVLEITREGGVTPPLPGDGYAPNWPASREVNAEGTFDLPGLIPGTYSIVVYRPSPTGGDRNMEQVPIQGHTLEVKPGARMENIEILLNPPEDYSLSGTVRDARGEPVVGLVTAVGSPTGRSWWTTTDARGAYYIDGLDGVGLAAVRVDFGGPAVPNVPINSGEVNLVMPDAGGIDGVVRDAATGAKVENFEVEVPVVRLPDGQAIWERPPVNVERNATGGFHISNVPAGEATVLVRAPGFGVQRFTTPVAGERPWTRCGDGRLSGSPQAQPGTEPAPRPTLDCALAGPAVLEGRTTLDGVPRGATLIVGQEWLRSNEQGDFRLDQFPNGDYTICCFTGDYTADNESWGYRSASVRLESGRTTRLDLELGGSGEIRGRVTCSAGESGWMVRLAARLGPAEWADDLRPAPEDFVLAASRIAPPGGEYRLRAVPPGRYYLVAGRKNQARIPRYQSVMSKVVDLKEGETLVLDLDLTEAR